mmetsp:Transcript_20434/g.31160  ORF Transcript_20434/g.31160 Transcript_20434/m.31160 type:complete len:82 (-) Transcript_20434:47-292(-)
MFVIKVGPAVPIYEDPPPRADIFDLAEVGYYWKICCFSGDRHSGSRSAHESELDFKISERWILPSSLLPSWLTCSNSEMSM